MDPAPAPALPALPAPDPEVEVVALAARWARAGGPVIALLNHLGGKVEEAAAALPAPLRTRIDHAVRAGLDRALRLAVAGRRAPVLGRRGAPVAAAAAGALGGAGGLATAVAEIPVTLTLILSAIAREAEAAGFDPAEPAVQAEMMRVLAQGGPVARDDGLDTAFLGARLALSGAAVQKLVATLAPSISALLTRVLATRAVPVLGAAAGAAVNAAYLSYWREAAAVRFGLMRLSVQHGPERIAALFAEATARPPLRHMDDAAR